MSGVDHDAPDPLYEQIARVIRERIEDGTYDRRVPGEMVLADEFDVSRPTVRSALDILAAEGLVRAVRGRGTFVIRPESGDANASSDRGNG
jgi:GntR family transcriptional regulator